jgi:hypothetical protein
VGTITLLIAIISYGNAIIYTKIDLPSQTFLVDRNLDSNMRIFRITVASRIWSDCTMISGVSLDV